MPDLAVLVVTIGPLSGQRIDVETELVIGREGDGLAIDDNEISRRHATVRLKGGVLELEDLGSLNGTFVNGRRIDAQTALNPGDVVKVGQTSLEVESVPQASGTVLSTPPRSVAATLQQARPAPAPSAAPPVAAAAVVPQQQNLGAFAPAAPARRRGSASRRMTPVVLTFAVIAVTALALIVYFAQH